MPDVYDTQLTTTTFQVDLLDASNSLYLTVLPLTAQARLPFSSLDIW